MLNFCGIKLKNPFIVASGPVTNTIEKLKMAHKNGAAAVSTKLAFYRRPFKSDARYYSEVSFGGIVSSDSRMEYKEIAELVKQAKNHTDLIIFCNITHDSNDAAGWLEMAKVLEEAGADALELNFNCPNITLTEKQISKKKVGSYGAIIGQSPDLCANVIRSLKENIKIPIIPKLTYRVSDISSVAEVCKTAGADGFTLASGYPSLPPVDIYNKGRLLNRFHSGVSLGSLGGSKANLIHSFANVALIAKNLSVPLIGGGGIRSWEDGINMMMWGATLVTACWAIMFHGFEFIGKMVNRMEDFLSEQGYSSWDEIIGVSVDNLIPGTEVEVKDYYVVVDEQKCQKCYKCLKMGHCEAIEPQKERLIVNREKCTGCGVCTTVCPHGAIKMEEFQNS